MNDRDPMIHRELGSLDARMDNLENRMNSVEKKLDSVLSILNQSKGGWKTIVAIGTISAAIGAAMVKLFSTLAHFPFPGR